VRLAEKVAVITGAGSGIGRASALAFADEGAKVVLLDMNASTLQETQSILENAGGSQTLAVAADMTKEDDVERAFSMTIERFMRIDIMFNVAGASGRRWGDGPVAECTLEGWRRTLDVNLTSTFLGSQFAVRQMLQQPEGGSLINLSSVLGLVGGDADFATHAYAAAKSGIIGLTRAIATYYAPQKIRANVICPGLIATGMSQRAQSNEKIRARLSDLQPLTGDFGSSDDVALAALYLGSDESRFVTGAVLTVDGGWTAR
jgi:NAD(P)-dependent dehydrogenase (short-subunit alcohol dehydrogenase family)